MSAAGPVAAAAVPAQPHPQQAAFRAALDALCIAAGPPAPSFSAAHLDAAVALALSDADLTAATEPQSTQVLAQQRAADAFAAIDAHLSADMRTTALSVRAMLWELLVRMCERSAALAHLKQQAAARPSAAAAAAAGTHPSAFLSSGSTTATATRDEWHLLLAPQLYRLVTLVVPRGSEEDAAPNVPLATQTLRRWMAAAESGAAPSFAAASSGAAVVAPVKFKKHQLINALKYVEGQNPQAPHAMRTAWPVACDISTQLTNTRCESRFRSL
jgi:hypothetical protein